MLRLVDVEDLPNGEGMRVYLIKETNGLGRSSDIGVSAYVNMTSIDNITFSKGVVVRKETSFNQ